MCKFLTETPGGRTALWTSAVAVFSYMPTIISPGLSRILTFGKTATQQNAEDVVTSTSEIIRNAPNNLPQESVFNEAVTKAVEILSKNSWISLGSVSSLCICITSAVLIDFYYFREQIKLNKIDGLSDSPSSGPWTLVCYTVCVLLSGMSKCGAQEPANQSYPILGALVLLSIWVAGSTKYFMFKYEKEKALALNKKP